MNNTPVIIKHIISEALAKNKNDRLKSLILNTYLKVY